MSNPQHRRRLINYFIDRRFQTLLFVPYLIGLVVLAITLSLTLHRAIAAFAQVNMDPASTEVMTLADVYRIINLVGCGGFLVTGIFGFVLLVLISHRVLGPIYAIHRHVRRLNAGEYHHRVRLRRGDQLHDLANDLNTLTERLENAAR